MFPKRDQNAIIIINPANDMKNAPAPVATQAAIISTNVTAKTWPVKPGISSMYLKMNGKKLNHTVPAMSENAGVKYIYSLSGKRIKCTAGPKYVHNMPITGKSKRHRASWYMLSDIPAKHASIAPATTILASKSPNHNAKIIHEPASTISRK